MKFSCNAKDIAAAVSAASKVVNAHTTVPILNNVLVSARGGRVSVRATDLELTLENSIGADVQEDGACTVPARLFSSYLANLPAASPWLSRTGWPWVVANPGLPQTRTCSH